MMTTDTKVREYTWKKVYAVQTSADDPVAVGDEITVTASAGDSTQLVLSVTDCLNRSGKPFKTLLVQEVK